MKNAGIYLKSGIAACLLSLAAGLAWADTLMLTDSQREVKFKNGLRFLLISATKQPYFDLKIYKGQKLLANYPYFWFDDFAESPDGNLIVGLSNYGMPDPAVAIFDSSGSLKLLARHNTVFNFDYCEQSISAIKEWYDKKNPNIRFEDSNKHQEITDITLRNCRGQQVRLVDTIAKANNDFLAERKEINKSEESKNCLNRRHESHRLESSELSIQKLPALVIHKFQT